MADRDEIALYANEYLNISAYKDYGPQGMQYVGRPDVEKIACAVSATGETILKAMAINADMLITHHGLFWNTEPRTIDKRLEARLDSLEVADISLLGYHLCLDAHSKVGNNILTAKALGLEKLTSFAEIGWGGEIPNHINIFKRIKELFPKAVHFGTKSPKPHKAAIVTGKADYLIHQAHAEGYNLFFTGEPGEYSLALADEMGIHFIAAGHYETEKIGVRALSQHLSEQFETYYEFIDVYNPI